MLEKLQSSIQPSINASIFVFGEKILYKYMYAFCSCNYSLCTGSK